MRSDITWSIERRKVKDLIPYYKNPRQLSEIQAAHLSESLDKFGLIDRPCINQNGTIIGGHQRITILNKLPEEEIEVMVPSRLLNNSEVEELNIRLNKNTGEFDYDVLANEWEITDLIQWGFEPSELGLAEFSGTAPEEKENEECEKCPTCNQKIKK
jgi:ParB-like chromosome segregation protein Spo0J